MNKQRLTIVIAAALGMLATFLPWTKVPLLGGINGLQFFGWVTMLLFAVPLVISLLNDRTTTIKGAALYSAIGASVLSALFGIVMATQMPYKIGFGLILVVLAGITIPIAGLFMKSE